MVKTALWGKDAIREHSSEWFEILDQIKAEEAARPRPQIPMDRYRATDRCPKCRTTTGTTEYHAGAHAGCPIPGSAGLGIGSFSSLERASKTAAEWREDALLRATASRAVWAASVPEHFDRVCPNCKHSWAEGLPEADA